MYFMLVAMDIYHRSGNLMRLDYLLCIGADLCFDKLTHTYPNYTSNFGKTYPPITGTMLPENMPGYRGPIMRSPPPADSSFPISFSACDTPLTQVDSSIVPIFTSINLDYSDGHHFNLHIYPILMGHLTPAEQKTCGYISLYNRDTTVLVGELLSHSFVVYELNTGHFASTSSCNSQTLDIVLAADSKRYVRAMFKQVNCSQITDSVTNLIQCIEALSATSTIHHYWLHSYRFLHRNTELAFWKF